MCTGIYILKYNIGYEIELPRCPQSNWGNIKCHSSTPFLFRQKQRQKWVWSQYSDFKITQKSCIYILHFALPLSVLSFFILSCLYSDAKVLREGCVFLAIWHSALLKVNDYYEKWILSEMAFSWLQLLLPVIPIIKLKPWASGCGLTSLRNAPTKPVGRH